ncbi:MULTISPECIES: hypothetical protein [Pseudomonas]|jgi:hypothetical protein|uniref:Uncharacterized protein n=1 Tax=Pseudomonas syringae TaxID=317 RepID=A0A085VB88_PSESX|nr:MULTISPECIES: hypothetical protein [Pseudomonas]EPJ87859.1 hypothetical protein CFII64_05320 [Pseudomonas sp. CFII64]KFE52701.1 hypothetical protein IV02_07425 [Pseudomonas syringae]
MFTLSQLKESWFPRREASPEQTALDAEVTGHQPAEPLMNIAMADASSAHLDDFVDGVEWDLLLVDLACFTEMPDYVGYSRL